MSDRKKILICPLDWGLGHATRCIPIIRELIKQGADVYIGGSDRALALLRNEFPELNEITIQGVGFNFPRGAFFFPKLLFFTRKFVKNIFRENQILEQLIEEHKFDVVISDNRYGLWNEKVLSIFITHQVAVKLPSWLKFLNPLLFRISKSYIDKFDKIWIPDVEGDNNLSGDLSHSYSIPEKTTFIGILSRFHKPIKKTESYKYELCVILSSVNPESFPFYERILYFLSVLKIKAVLFTGMTWLPAEKSTINNLDIYNHLGTEAMQKVIEESRIVLSRSGYSSIMDLATIGKNAILIPTRGQTEQEYLAKRLTDKGLIYYQTEKDFNLEMALKECEKYKGLNIENNPELLINAVKEIIDM
jgi:uncharacterized protein (TIGR00661 family)